MGSGEIYAAYPQDAGTKAVNKDYRISPRKPIPVEIAIKTDPRTINSSFANYNELLIKKWKVSGIFYVKNRTDAETINKLKIISEKYNRPLYEYDFETKEIKRIK